MFSVSYFSQVTSNEHFKGSLLCNLHLCLGNLHGNVKIQYTVNK